MASLTDIFYLIAVIYAEPNGFLMDIFDWIFKITTDWL